MNRISKILVLLLLAGVTLAQPPGELLPIFPAPLDDVLVPWPDVERVDDALCWPNEPPPFIGAAYTFMCFHSPLALPALRTGLMAGFGDAGYHIGANPGFPHWTGAQTVLTYTTNWAVERQLRTELYIFDHAETGTLFSVAAEF